MVFFFSYGRVGRLYLKAVGSMGSVLDRMFRIFFGYFRCFFKCCLVYVYSFIFWGKCRFV